MRCITAKDLKNFKGKGGKAAREEAVLQARKQTMSQEDRRKEGAKRVQKAEDILFRVQELIEESQRELSACKSGLNQNWSKLGDIYQAVRNQMYDLQRCRETGLVEIDETMARIMKMTAR